MIKKLGILVLVFVVLCNILCSCGIAWKAVYEHGLDNFNYGWDYSLTLLIPEGMLTEYEYIDGDFWGYLQEGDPWPFGKTFIYLQYDGDTYESAKEYMCEKEGSEANMETPEYAENGYVFYCTITDEFPAWGWWFGFNDELKTLYFFGLYNSDNPKAITSTGETYAARAIALDEKEGFAGFLREYYSEYYDFGI